MKKRELFSICQRCRFPNRKLLFSSAKDAVSDFGSSCFSSAKYAVFRFEAPVLDLPRMPFSDLKLLFTSAKYAVFRSEAPVFIWHKCCFQSQAPVFSSAKVAVLFAPGHPRGLLVYYNQALPRPSPVRKSSAS
jgi:hypothetical protein